MTRLKITAPVKGYRGDLAGLVFRDGVAYADIESDAAALAYCRRRGYAVEAPDADVAEEALAPEVVDGEVERPKDYAPKSEWVTYAVSQGADPDDAENATKAELVELYGK